MAWHAQMGKLVLTGEEAKLFRDALVALAEVIADSEDDEAFCFEGASVFDCMSRSQQLASLEVVASHLFHTTPECLPLTAWSEATLASLLNEVRALVLAEAGEVEEKRTYRQTVLDTLDAHDEIEVWDDLEEWDNVLDSYDERFLWDLDYEDEQASDLSPEQSRQNQVVMGIGEEYYSAIPPDFGVAETPQDGVRRVLRAVDGRAI